MIYMTENMVKLAKELAAFAVVEIGVRESELLIRATPYKAPPREKGRPTLSEKGKILGRPEVRHASNGKRLKLFEFNGERLSAAEWAERYGVTEKAMRQRFARSGTPEAEERHSKSERTSLKAKLSK